MKIERGREGEGVKTERGREGEGVKVERGREGGVKIKTGR